MDNKVQVKEVKSEGEKRHSFPKLPSVSVTHRLPVRIHELLESVDDDDDSVDVSQSSVSSEDDPQETANESKGLDNIEENNEDDLTLNNHQVVPNEPVKSGIDIVKRLPNRPACSIDEKIAASKPCDAQSNSTAMETPLKQLHMGPSHSVPCNSQRNIFVTPQSKMQSTVANHEQTPATILSSWNKGLTFQTPSLKENSITPRNVMSQPFQRMSRYTTNRNVGESASCRKPLVEKMVNNPSREENKILNSLDNKNQHKSTGLQSGLGISPVAEEDLGVQHLSLHNENQREEKNLPDQVDYRVGQHPVSFKEGSRVSANSNNYNNQRNFTVHSVTRPEQSEYRVGLPVKPACNEVSQNPAIPKSFPSNTIVKLEPRESYAEPLATSITTHHEQSLTQSESSNSSTKSSISSQRSFSSSMTVKTEINDVAPSFVKKETISPEYPNTLRNSLYNCGSQIRRSNEYQAATARSRSPNNPEPAMDLKIDVKPRNFSSQFASEAPLPVSQPIKQRQPSPDYREPSPDPRFLTNPKTTATHLMPRSETMPDPLEYRQRPRLMNYNEPPADQRSAHTVNPRNFSGVRTEMIGEFKKEVLPSKYTEHARTEVPRANYLAAEQQPHCIENLVDKQSTTPAAYGNTYEGANPRQRHTAVPQSLSQLSQFQNVIMPGPGQSQPKIYVVKDKSFIELSLIGKGMSCQVFRVQDLSTRKLYAMKIVDLSALAPELCKGSLEEIELLRTLQGTPIVSLIDFEIKGTILHVILELGDTDFSQVLKSMPQKRQIPYPMILYYWMEMLGAVKHIHDNNVIHSDLKPANFLLVRGRLKLIDFGIASRLSGEVTSIIKESSAGTMNYISPEALRDTATDSPTRNTKFKLTYTSDIWSMGIILYLMIYGYTPFSNIKNQFAKMNAITDPKRQIPFPTTVPDKEDFKPPPPILLDIMKRCFLHNPKARPTAKQLLEIDYYSMNLNKSIRPKPNIPPTILLKIKSALSDDEWRELTDALEGKNQ